MFLFDYKANFQLFPPCKNSFRPNSQDSIRNDHSAGIKVSGFEGNRGLLRGKLGGARVILQQKKHIFIADTRIGRQNLLIYNVSRVHENETL